MSNPKGPGPLRDTGISWVVPGVLLVQADPSSKVREQLERVCSRVVGGPEELMDRGEGPHFPRAQGLAGPLRSKRGPGEIWSQAATGIRDWDAGLEPGLWELTGSFKPN